LPVFTEGLIGGHIATDIIIIIIISGGVGALAKPAAPPERSARARAESLSATVAPIKISDVI
jgi:hypothetical protein